MNPYIFQLLGELNFWISLSREHPIFIKEIAQSQHILLDTSLQKHLNKNYKDFSGLHKNINILMNQLRSNFTLCPPPNNPYFLLEVSANLHNIIQVNVDFIDILKKLGHLGSRN